MAIRAVVYPPRGWVRGRDPDRLGFYGMVIEYAARADAEAFVRWARSVEPRCRVLLTDMVAETSELWR